MTQPTSTQGLETDYLMVGSGAVGMAFADTLVAESDATMIIVDRHHGPGGHWNDAYPFVRLHQPSAYYGVNSRKLGNDAHDATGINIGMYERATSAELISYYEAVMQHMLASGRVQYFPMCDYLGVQDGSHQFKSLTSGQVRRVAVRQKLVDTTYLQTAVPSTHPPKYSVEAGIQCVPLNDLPRIKSAHSGYVVVGSGKTGIDACLWLLENDVPPSAITWIMPRDAWYLNRATVQPGQDFFVQSYGAFATQLECIARAKSLSELFAQLEDTRQLLRLDQNVQPTMYHSAIMSESEMRLLQTIQNIVRMGRVQRVNANQIVLQKGSIPNDPRRLIVDCSASAVVRRPIIPVFSGNTITPQFIRTVQPTFSAALIAHVEARMDDEAEKNKICNVIGLPDEPVDWLRMYSVNMANQYRWSKNKALRPWIEASRLDGFTALANDVQEEETDKVAVLQRFAACAGAAIANMPKLLAGAPALPQTVA